MNRIGGIRRFLPKTRMGIFTTILVALWLLKTFLVAPLAGHPLSVGPQSLDLLTLLLVIPVVHYTVKFSRTVRARLLWKIRRRLILAHIFSGAIPVLLVLVIVYVSALLCYYQLSYYLISNQIGIHSGHVQAFTQALRAALDQEAGPAGPDPGTIRKLVDAESNAILAAYPSASVIVRVQDDRGRRVFAVGNRNVHKELLADYRLPQWLGQQEFSGLVLEKRQPSYYISSLREGADRRRARLYLRGTTASEPTPGLTVTVEVSVPFDRYMLDRLKAAVGLEMLLADHVPLSGLSSVILQNTGLLRENVLSSTSDVDLSGQSLGRPVWSVLLFPVSWDTGEEASPGESEVLFVELSTTRLFQNLFRSESNVSRTILGVLQVVIGFFLVVEILSLVVGILLTKSITSAVYNLDRGTEFIKRGDFSHRVVVRSRDQLGALAASFNQMTEYIQSLVKERVQKERLERELEIAKEVQEQLFPRRAPRMSRIEFSGLCLPARVVSGDYYDFLVLGPERVGMAVGDICGKGISAALLMANLQATLRTNVANLARRNGPGTDGESSVAEVVRLLNDHIYNYTSANKFASVFYGVYDNTGCRLTYCNAGHNPPLFFRDGTFRRLETGGTVVGIFPDADFSQETIEFQQGDLFVAYTDGIIESVNEYGEEFGEERLVDLVGANRSRSAEEIQQAIVNAVLEWAYEEERDDDMTLIIAKVR